MLELICRRSSAGVIWFSGWSQTQLREHTLQCSTNMWSVSVKWNIISLDGFVLLWWLQYCRNRHTLGWMLQLKACLTKLTEMIYCGILSCIFTWILTFMQTVLPLLICVQSHFYCLSVVLCFHAVFLFSSVSILEPPNLTHSTSVQSFCFAVFPQSAVVLSLSTG